MTKHEKLVEEIARIIDPKPFDEWDESWAKAPGKMTNDSLSGVPARERARKKARQILIKLESVLVA